MKFGHFDDKNREYVITTPKTPYPWINYLGSDNFFGLVSHQAGGYCFFRDAKLRRLTRYRYNNVPTDSGGRYFYITEGKDYWSPSYMPVKRELESFECRHGLGYSKITGKRNGLKCELLFFVPLGHTAEVHQVTLTNESSAKKSFKLFSFAEWCLWNAADDSAKALTASLKDDYKRGLAQEIQDNVLRIYEACNFQDIAGQRIGNVMKTLAAIETQVADMLSRCDDIPAAGPVARSALPPERGLLNGPKLDHDAGHARPPHRGHKAHGADLLTRGNEARCGRCFPGHGQCAHHRCARSARADAAGAEPQQGHTRFHGDRGDNAAASDDHQTLGGGGSLSNLGS